MSIVNDLIKNLVQDNTIELNGAFTISVVTGGLSVKGSALSTLKDKGKVIFNADTPIDAQVSVGEIVIPVPQIK